MSCKGEKIYLVNIIISRFNNVKVITIVAFVNDAVSWLTDVFKHGIENLVELVFIQSNKC